jgi:ribosomal-protein-alanine N-acetyltransferase
MADLEEICEIELECFSNDAFPKLYYASLLISPDVIFLKSCIQSTIVGFIVGLIRQIDDGLECLIATVNVRREFRRKGTATALVRALENRLIGRCCSKVTLQVGLDNTASIGLFMKLHYQKLSILRNYYGSGRDAFKMGKTLD